MFLQFTVIIDMIYASPANDTTNVAEQITKRIEFV